MIQNFVLALSEYWNLLDDETIDIETVALVANSGGLELLKATSPQRKQVLYLIDRGVTVKQCSNTIEGTDVSEDDLIEGVELVSSGVGELTRLQHEEVGYIKP